MVTVTRNKNIIELLLEGKATPYKFDINTGLVYGLRGNPIKTVPKEVYKSLLTNRNNIYLSNGTTELQKVMYCITDDSVSRMYMLSQHSDILKLADSFDNLGISLGTSVYGSRDSYNQLSNDKAKTKRYIKYAQESIAKSEHYSYTLFLDLEKARMVSEKLGQEIEAEPYDFIRNILANHIANKTDRQIKCFKVNFIDNGYVLTVQNTYDLNIIFKQYDNYCRYCEFLNEKVTTKDNFLTEYARIHRAYTRQKEKVNQEMFTKAINMHKSEMEFEYGDFQVVIPTCPQDIKNEGKDMHHCVGGYAKRCIEFENPNRSYIVFIRNKANLDKCYITCEIKNGRICQYYLSHDRRISTQEDIEFKNAYQIHLNLNWNKE